MRVEIEKSTAEGAVIAPPSKSLAHRLMIACALSQKGGKVVGISDSEDMAATLDCIKTLGITSQKNGDTVTFKKDCENAETDEHGTKTQGFENGKNSEFANGTGVFANGKNNLHAVDDCLKNAKIFDCRESGSTLRFFLPIAAAFFEKSVFVGSKRLLERGVKVYEKALGEKGVKVVCDGEKITLSGRLESGIYTLRGDVSSQYVSGLLFALPLLCGDSEIRVLPPVESRSYIDLTVDVLKKAGIEIAEKEENVFSIKGNQRYSGGEYVVEGDWSNGAMLLALNELGGNVEVEGLDENSVQGDKVCKTIFKELNEKNAVIDLANCPDLAPIAFCVAAVKEGATFVGTRRLKIKESDRAQAMAQELAKFGIDVEVHENEVVIHKNDIKTPDCAICGHNDHRIVMACSILLSAVGGVIDGAEAVKKSFPNFFETIGKLGVKYEIE